MGGRSSKTMCILFPCVHENEGFGCTNHLGILGWVSKISNVDTGERMQSCVGEGKLTHRTCKATAPSVLSLFVNRSEGNSCRAAKDRKPGSGHFIYSNARWVLSEDGAQNTFPMLCRSLNSVPSRELLKLKPSMRRPSNCVLPGTAYEYPSSERRVKWKTVGGRREGKEERAP